MSRPCKKCGGTERTAKGACRPCKLAYDRAFTTRRRRQGLDPWLNRVSTSTYRMEMKRRLMQELGVEGCQHCDFIVRSPMEAAAIDFHHTDYRQKRFSIAVGISQKFSFGKLLAEAKKCQILCSNCHRIHHAREGDMLEMSRAGKEARRAAAG